MILVQPNRRHKLAYVNMLNDFCIEYGKTSFSYADFLEENEKIKNGVHRNKVPYTLYWLMDDDQKEIYAEAKFNHYIEKQRLGETKSHIELRITPLRKDDKKCLVIIGMLLKKAGEYGLDEVFFSFTNTMIKEEINKYKFNGFKTIPTNEGNVYIYCLETKKFEVLPKYKKIKGDVVSLKLRGILDKDNSIGHVTAYVYDIIVNRFYKVGTIDIRMGNNEMLELYGGHIGYGIKPKYRGNGYAEKAARLLLGMAKEIGFKRLILTCNPENIASKKTIKKLNGKFMSIYKADSDLLPVHVRDRVKERYVIEL